MQQRSPRAHARPDTWHTNQAVEAAAFWALLQQTQHSLLDVLTALEAAKNGGGDSVGSQAPSGASNQSPELKARLLEIMEHRELLSLMLAHGGGGEGGEGVPLQAVQAHGGHGGCAPECGRDFVESPGSGSHSVGSSAGGSQPHRTSVPSTRAPTAGWAGSVVTRGSSDAGSVNFLALEQAAQQQQQSTAAQQRPRTQRTSAASGGTPGSNHRTARPASYAALHAAATASLSPTRSPRGSYASGGAASSASPVFGSPMQHSSPHASESGRQRSSATGSTPRGAVASPAQQRQRQQHRQATRASPPASAAALKLVEHACAAAAAYLSDGSQPSPSAAVLPPSLGADCPSTPTAPTADPTALGPSPASTAAALAAGGRVSQLEALLAAGLQGLVATRRKAEALGMLLALAGTDNAALRSQLVASRAQMSEQQARLKRSSAALAAASGRMRDNLGMGAIEAQASAGAGDAAHRGAAMAPLAPGRVARGAGLRPDCPVGESPAPARRSAWGSSTDTSDGGESLLEHERVRSGANAATSSSTAAAPSRRRHGSVDMSPSDALHMLPLLQVHSRIRQSSAPGGGSSGSAGSPAAAAEVAPVLAGATPTKRVAPLSPVPAAAQAQAQVRSPAPRPVSAPGQAHERAPSPMSSAPPGATTPAPVAAAAAAAAEAAAAAAEAAVLVTSPPALPPLPLAPIAPAHASARPSPQRGGRPPVPTAAAGAGGAAATPPPPPQEAASRMLQKAGGSSDDAPPPADALNALTASELASVAYPVARSTLAAAAATAHAHTRARSPAIGRPTSRSPGCAARGKPPQLADAGAELDRKDQSPKRAHRTTPPPSSLAMAGRLDLDALSWLVGAPQPTLAQLRRSMTGAHVGSSSLPASPFKAAPATAPVIATTTAAAAAARSPLRARGGLSPLRAASVPCSPAPPPPPGLQLHPHPNMGGAEDWLQAVSQASSPTLTPRHGQRPRRVHVPPDDATAAGAAAEARGQDGDNDENARAGSATAAVEEAAVCGSHGARGAAGRRLVGVVVSAAAAAVAFCVFLALEDAGGARRKSKGGTPAGRAPPRSRRGLPGMDASSVLMCITVDVSDD